MSAGYDTMVGEGAQLLSGGQRQRIGIARVMLRDSPILLLDEPTAALDSESERTVIEALERLMKNRTVIMIAHRLSTIRDANQIIVLKDGVVAEQGSHDELIARMVCTRNCIGRSLPTPRCAMCSLCRRHVHLRAQCPQPLLPLIRGDAIMSRELIVLPNDSPQAFLDSIAAARESLRIKMFLFSDPSLSKPSSAPTSAA